MVRGDLGSTSVQRQRASPYPPSLTATDHCSALRKNCLWRSTAGRIASEPKREPGALAMKRMAVVEAAYRFDFSEQESLAEIARLTNRIFHGKRPSVAWLVHRTESQAFLLEDVASDDDEAVLRFRRMWPTIPEPTVRRMAGGASELTTSQRLMGLKATLELFKSMGTRQFTGLVCPTELGFIGIGPTAVDPLTPSSRALREWNPVAAHVAAAWRLRHALLAGNVERVSFSPQGALVEEGPSRAAPSTLALLRQAVLDREFVRAREGLWPELIQGEWTLVDRFEKSGRRYVVAHRNDHSAMPMRVLSAGETRVLSDAMNGVSGKATAMNMGISEPSVSKMLSKALRRLGLTHVGEALQFRSMTAASLRVGDNDLKVLSATTAPQAGLALHNVSLTRSERSILPSLIEGHSNKRIAAMRGASPRTVAHQIASIFGKLGVHSRRELLARILCTLGVSENLLLDRTV